ncbi:MAG TPA: hypothetical protein VG937_30860 [Polyangiaceae bacterium]|nr:hypothetical protein [Polyangiaceae bacterium]
MEAVIEIPSPTPRDSETVVTALETAAVFRAKGDAAEALRWLQRAAESAGDDGDDERTLALARTAADLSRALHEPAAASSKTEELHASPPSRRLPKPPLRAGSAKTIEEHAEPPQSIARASHTPSPEAVSHAGPPPAPSSRPLPLSPNGRPAYSHAAASARAPGPPPATRSTPPAQGYQPRYSSPSSTPAAAPATPVPAAAPPPLRVELREAELPAFPSTDADDAEAQRVTQPVPEPLSYGADVRQAPRLRQAARVSVVPSPSEPGLFLVRLLDDGAVPPSEAAEALMVLVDPSSNLFSE